MKTQNLHRVVSLLILVPMALNAQTARSRDAVPLKHWQAPQYWQPPQSEAGANALQLDAMGNPSAQAQAATAVPLVFVATTPCRVMDTRGNGFTGSFGPPTLQGGQARIVPIPSSVCGIPSAAAYSLNFTLIALCCGPVGFVAAWPDDKPFPGTSITNAFNGGVIANAAVVPAGADGGINVMVSSNGDVVIDINGYYIPAPSGSSPTGPAAIYNVLSQQVANTAPPVRVNFDQKVADDQSTVTSGQFWQFKAPVAGVYHVNASVQFPNNQVPLGYYTTLVIQVQKSGSGTPVQWLGAPTYNGLFASIATDVVLGVNDVLWIEISQTTGKSQATAGQFAIHYVHP